jgi:Ser/Thr protein kinase RdoA (MazF antagonist)
MSPLSGEGRKAAREVLLRYGLPPDITACPGGFSGARIWRVESPAGLLCLKAWPPHESSRERLTWIHGLMQRARREGLRFVPEVFPDGDGQTCVEHVGRLWDLTDWMPGRADFHERPTPERLRPACVGLAQLHEAWRSAGAFRPGPFPAVRRRVERARAWLELTGSGWRPEFASPPGDPVHPWAERAWDLVRNRIQEIPHLLGTPFPYPVGTPNSPGEYLVQPCLCDVWHDHVLYEGSAVTGLIDYGSTKLDHVAVDLARLLGSLAGDDRALRTTGLQAYCGARRQSPGVLEPLVDALDRTGTLIGAANWLLWLYLDGRVFDDRRRVADRLAQLVRRIEGWK